MDTVYILYSPSLSKFYIGSCTDMFSRVNQHLSSYFPGAFTGKAKDWVIYFQLDELAYQQARKIEAHIKRMKSKKFIESLKNYPELSMKLIRLYK